MTSQWISPTTGWQIMRSCRGFTLLEMIASLTISAILLLGLTSLLSIGLKAATPSPTAEATRQAADITDLILRDVCSARSFGTLTSNEIEMKVPGQEPGSLDSIRYKWQGKTDKRLLRSINGAAFHQIAQQIDPFEFYFSTQQVSLETPAIQSIADDVIQQYRTTAFTNAQQFNTSTSNWIAQRFQPVLHPEAISWSITRISLYLKRSISGQSGQFRIKIHPIDPATGKPMNMEVTSVLVDTPSLPTEYQWTAFDFPEPVALNPSAAYAFVIAPFGSAGNMPQIEFRQGFFQLVTNAYRMTSGNAGSTWSTPDGLSCLRFQIDGTVKTQTWK